MRETIGGACLGIGVVQLVGLVFWADFSWARLVVGLALLLAGSVLVGFVVASRRRA